MANYTGKGLKPFKKGQSGNPSGKRKLSPELKAIKELTADELKRHISKHFRMEHEEVKAVLKNPKTTMLDAMLASAMVSAAKTGDIGKAEHLFNRCIGKPKETVEITQPEPVIIKRTDGGIVELSTTIGDDDGDETESATE